MPNYAIIQNGKVVNAVVAETDYAQTQGWTLLPDGVGVDWDYDGTNFIDNRPKPETTTPPELTKEQLLAQLADLTTKINALGA